MLGQETTERRTGEARRHPDAAHIGLVAAALARRDRVAENGLRQRENAAAADPLQAAGEDERDHVGRDRAGGGAGDEDADAREHHGAPPVDVAELAVERRDHGGGQQIGGHHPRQQLEVAEVAPDGRQRGGDDGLVERGQEHRQHEAEHDGADVAMAEHPAPGLRAGRRRDGRFFFRHSRHVPRSSALPRTTGRAVPDCRK